MDKAIDWRGVAIAVLAVAAAIVIIGIFATSIVGRATDVGCVGTCLDRHDLAMQTNMALAAWAMALVSAVSLAVGAVSLYYLRANLRETRNIGEAQTRAYLVVMEASVERARATNWKVRLKFRNSGQTPAIALKTDLLIWAEAEKDGVWRQTPTPGIREIRTRSDTASQDTKHATFTFSVDPFRSPQGEEVTRMRTMITIHYRDVFGARHGTSSSYYLDVTYLTEPPLKGNLPMMRSLDDYD